MKLPQKKLHFRGKVVTLKLDGFDINLPIAVVNLRNNDSLIINLQGIPPEMIEKQTVMRKAHILTEDFGELRMIATRMVNRYVFTGREITVNGVSFMEAHFETSKDLVTAFLPKDPNYKPPVMDENAPKVEPPRFQADEDYPSLYGTLLGRRFTHVRVLSNSEQKEYRLLLGPVAA